jgi:CheY-like chemotaxis protein
VRNTSSLLSGLRVLLVDDYVDHQRLYARALEERGAFVTPVGSMHEAFSLFEWVAPHVVVSELKLIDGDGCQLIEAIRALGPERNGDVPAVAITTSQRERDRIRAMASGFNRHCTKTADLDTFLATVAEASGRKRPTSPLRKLA